jgi:serine protease Do
MRIMIVSKKGLVFLLLISVLIGSGMTAGLHLHSAEGASDSGLVNRPTVVQNPFSEQLFIEVSKRVTPAVVNISTKRLIKEREGQAPAAPFFNDPFFKRFFGQEPFTFPEIPKERREQSLGSGVIVDQKGYVITNNHVVEKADEIKVVLNDRREFKGKIVGSDPKTDIAVVKIDGKDLPTVPWADSSHLQVGELVLAIGNPFGLNNTVTMGIVSAVGRANVGIADYEDFIQTDAAINPGNSGGALVNTRGELVGINTAIFSQSGGYMGIGFAVPSNMAKSVLNSLVRTGKVVRGWLGVSIQEVTPSLAKEFGLPEPKGALVGEVVPGSPAEHAGIQRGDVILELNGKTIEHTGQLRNLVADTPIGEKVKVKIFRDKQTKEVAVTIGEQPKEMASSGAAEERKEKSTALNGVEALDITPETAGEYGLSKDQRGVVISRIEPGSLAEEAGLQRGDVIVEVNRKPVKNIEEYNAAVTKTKENEAVLLLVKRQGGMIFVTISP